MAARRWQLPRWAPGLERVWWWLVVVLVVSLMTQNLMGSFTLVLAQEFEGFLEDMNDAEELETPIWVPASRTPVESRSFHSSDPGPPVSEKSVKKEPDSRGTTTRPPGNLPESPLDYWDEDEFEGLPVDPQTKPVIATPEKETEGNIGVGKTEAQSPEPKPLQSYYVEAAWVAFLIGYAVAYYFGKRKNEKIALAWAGQFVGKDSIFEKNFSLLGTGDGPNDPLLVKEGQNVFKFYASGRRYCESLLATMHLQFRHDLISRAWYLISPKKDELTIDVLMNDDSMDPLVFALTRRKQAKEMHKESKDLQQFATILAQTSSQRKWVSEELAVISESRELATDLLTDGLLDQVFGEKAFENYSAYFLSLHFTDQHPVRTHKKMLQFKFVMPPQHRMADIARLVSIVPYFIDAIGRYKLSAQARSKATTVRAKVSQESFKESAKDRQEALQRKKLERRKAVEDSEMTSSKREEKDRLRQLKKSMPKVKMTRAH